MQQRVQQVQLYSRAGAAARSASAALVELAQPVQLVHAALVELAQPVQQVQL